MISMSLSGFCVHLLTEPKRPAHESRVRVSSKIGRHVVFIGGACDPNISLAMPIVLSATKPLRLHKPVAAAPFTLSFSVFPSSICILYTPAAKPLLRAPPFPGWIPLEHIYLVLELLEMVVEPTRDQRNHAASRWKACPETALLK